MNGFTSGFESFGIEQHPRSLAFGCFVQISIMPENSVFQIIGLADVESTGSGRLKDVGVKHKEA
jgi:hypothetical protein